MVTRIELLALIQGYDGEAFSVHVDSSAPISELKSKVREETKNGASRDVNPADFTLWKLKVPMNSNCLRARLSQTDISEICVEIPSDETVSKWFLEPPPSSIHFVVERGQFI
ncbi:hypothetical protein BD410DRAFT_780559 [Rickenella mellea]|uniref:Crinkler effector protein N-terminal domain-containing protein n=1 Tax=Rickenella mellea TaxID=50990 RepID=A0A4R5XFX2_9AGAM|nr:hypothetical protein BD410DRAFT_780559 [Rickenella mellea]